MAKTTTRRRLTVSTRRKSVRRIATRDRKANLLKSSQSQRTDVANTVDANKVSIYEGKPHMNYSIVRKYRTPDNLAQMIEAQQLNTRGNRLPGSLKEVLSHEQSHLHHPHQSSPGARVKGAEMAPSLSLFPFLPHIPSNLAWRHASHPGRMRDEGGPQLNAVPSGPSPRRGVGADRRRVKELVWYLEVKEGRNSAPFAFPARSCAGTPVLPLLPSPGPRRRFITPPTSLSPFSPPFHIVEHLQSCAQLSSHVLHYFAKGGFLLHIRTSEMVQNEGFLTLSCRSAVTGRITYDISILRANARLHHRSSKLDPRPDVRSTQQTVAPFEFRAGLEIEIEFISNRGNLWFEVSIRDQQPSSTNISHFGIKVKESENQNHEISLVQHLYIGTKIKLDPVAELRSFDLGSGKMLVQPDSEILNLARRQMQMTENETRHELEHGIARCLCLARRCTNCDKNIQRGALIGRRATDNTETAVFSAAFRLRVHDPLSSSANRTYGANSTTARVKWAFHRRVSARISSVCTRAACSRWLARDLGGGGLAFPLRLSPSRADITVQVCVLASTVGWKARPILETPHTMRALFPLCVSSLLRTRISPSASFMYTHIYRLFTAQRLVDSEIIRDGASCTGKKGHGKESAMVFGWHPSQHSPGVISENHGKPKQGWPDRESNPGPPECESNELSLRHLARKSMPVWLLTIVSAVWPTCSRRVAGSRPSASAAADFQFACLTGNLLAIYAAMLAVSGWQHCAFPPSAGEIRPRAITEVLKGKGPAVAERLGCSPPTKTNRVQSPAVPLPDSRVWQSCRTIGLSPGSPAFTVPSFRRSSILTSIILFGSHLRGIPRTIFLTHQDHPAGWLNEWLNMFEKYDSKEEGYRNINFVKENLRRRNGFFKPLEEDVSFIGFLDVDTIARTGEPMRSSRSEVESIRSEDRMQTREEFPDKLSTICNVSHFRHTQKSSVVPPGIEPLSSWEASTLPTRTGSHRIRRNKTLLTSHQGEPGSIPGRVTPGFSHVGIVPDDATGWRVFSEISLLPHPLFPALLHTHHNHPNRLPGPRC
ncbi:hypothetical protein PR048_010367 [Dryococelus australis]|uniref:Uncharacterized protein n=1 Tax=Dryococelus australis TaxID=614101 RepID=A0ABQ9I4I1_9NEOP|nr:hypothetical protein PR048_010367 [Dryococelus australis]